jgi:hypothetical protein
MRAEFGTPVNISATATVFARKGALLGFYVNSTTGGTLVLRDNGSGGTAVTGTITPAIGFHRMPIYFPHDCHATIANTLDVTFFFSTD